MAEGEQPRAVLPPGLDLLWGRRARGQRGPRPGLSADGIVEAAVRVADAEGLDAVSMSRVAAEVGFTPMSLYRHVASKEEQLQLMWNASARGAETLELRGEGWRERLRCWAQVQRDMIDRHPWITQMPMATPPVAPSSLAFVELGLGTLDGTGLADADKLRVIGLLSSYTLSEARMAHDAARATQQAAATGGSGPGWTFEALVRELVDAERFPRLHALAWSAPSGDDPGGTADRAEDAEQAEFAFGLDRILDGVAALVSASLGDSDGGITPGARTSPAGSPPPG